MAVMVLRRLRAVVLCIASLGAAFCSATSAIAQSSATSAPLAPALPVVGDTRDARANNLVILDSIVFVLGVGILGGVLVWWGLRIYKEK